MAQVDVSINGQSYRIACEDGQEDRLVDLATMVDEKVSDLVKGMVIISGNDASVALAEHIAGSEENFVYLMDQYAVDLGLRNSDFKHQKSHICQKSENDQLAVHARELLFKLI